ncbi:MAG TPA: ATP-grasp domain-containing protein [Methanobacteriaceae archaeon]|nr:ATP-grasp domain-containing protein [Methanobacteriaceae archaeon]
METILVVGVNTRAVACSLKKLGYKVYSADYFGVTDLENCTYLSRSIVKQRAGESCGYFKKDFNPGDLKKNALSLMDWVDKVICLSGCSPSDFPPAKIYGNPSPWDDKGLLYHALKDDFLLPLTYMPGSIAEAREIIQQYPDKKFIIKPKSGAGGYGIRVWDDPENWPVDWLLQEHIIGDNISASVLSTAEESRTIITSQQIIGAGELGQKEPFGYTGNITPYCGQANIVELAEIVINRLGLVGSNGVDFIAKKGEVYVVEVNPRIQGTFECVEKSLGINMAKAHIEACKGRIVPIPTPQKFAVKMVVHAQERSKAGRINFRDVHDLPLEGVIIEAGEPAATILSSDSVMENAIHKANLGVTSVYENLSPYNKPIISP